MPRTDQHTAQYLQQALTRTIIGAFYDVYNELGHGLAETVYERALAIALAEQNLAAPQQAPVDVWYRGQRVGRYRADIIVNDVVVLELKARPNLEPAHEAQLLNLLRASQLEVGLLLNFGPKPQIKRLIASKAADLR